MTPNVPEDAYLAEAFEQLLLVGEDAPNLADKLRLTRVIRRHSPQVAEQLDAFLLERAGSFKIGLVEAREKQKQLRKLLESMTEPPWYPAIYIGSARTAGGHPAALVGFEGNRRIVNIPESVDVSGVNRGEEVYLGGERNAIVATSPSAPFTSGETAVFDRLLDDGRIVLRARDEEIVADAAARLVAEELRSGDLVRWDRSLWMAFERLQRSEGAHLFLENTPAQTFADVGGLDNPIREIQALILLRLHHQQTARRYLLRGLRSVLLVGRPGNGKTMIARALANWLATLAASGRSRFINVKPGSLSSMWYGQTEANYREVFRVARDAAETDQDIPVVIFFDEVDAVGAARGESLVRVDDRVLTAFMAELDGLEDRGNILVVAATNRPDALDEALFRPDRLGDKKLEIPRPNRDAAREIFARHLQEQIPYADAANRGVPATRAELIDAAVARIYAPNGHGDVATITFRNGNTRSVGARDLVSGAVIAQIAREAVLAACIRDMNTGESGVQLSDLLEAVEKAFEATARILTARNCHRYVDDLPQDVDIVKVEPAQRRHRRAYRFLQVA